MTDVTRDEFQMALEQIRTNANRLDEIDRSGTRGVGVLAMQVAELGKDMGQMQQQMSDHERNHKEDAAKAEAAKVSARRFRVTAGLAAVAAWVAAMGVLIDLAVHMHVLH